MIRGLVIGKFMPVHNGNGHAEADFTTLVSLVKRSPLFGA